LTPTDSRPPGSKPCLRPYEFDYISFIFKSCSLVPVASLFEVETVRIITSTRRVFQTSDMNAFHGSVTSIKSSKLLAEIELTTASQLKIVAVVTNDSYEHLQIAPATRLVGTVPPASVLILKAESAGPPPTHSKSKSSFEIANIQTSARNKLLCRVTDIQHDANPGLGAESSVGSIAATITCEVQPHGGVTMVGGGERVTALVTSESVKGLGLERGQFVWIMWKAFSVVLARDE